MTKIGIIGANAPEKVLERCLARFGFEAVYVNHCLVRSRPDDELKDVLARDGIERYAAAFMENVSCPRTNDRSYKSELKKRIEKENISGLVVNTYKFCDFQHFDHRYFKENCLIPIMIIEHELDAQSEGQIMTRLEAFFEGMKKKVKVDTKLKDKKGYFVGIDSGSHATKLVCIDENKNVIARHIVPTGTSVKRSVADALKKLEEQGVVRSSIKKIVATGYGRNNVEGADEIVTEITCHATGAYHVLGRKGTVIDIGGQDSKAIRIGDDGKVLQFAMNDKCAAGTGRFLEVMASKLEIGLEEFANMAQGAGNAVPVSSMCSVFAESEVISLIASGSPKEEIAKGIHRAIAERTASLSRRIGGEAPYFMAGGVAKNRCLVAELEAFLGSKIDVIEEPQFTGALGAALIAHKG